MTNALITVQVRGLKGLRDQLEQLPLKTRQRIARKTLRQAAEIMKAEAISRCPRRTGALQASIKAKVSIKEAGERAQISAGGIQAWYAHLVEWGFVHTGPGEKKEDRVRPTKRGVVDGKAFLRNTAEAKFEPVTELFQDALAELVDKAIKKQNKT